MQEQGTTASPPSSPLRQLETLEDRTEFLLHRVAKLAYDRQNIIQDVMHTISADSASLVASLEELRAVSCRLVPQFVDGSASLARRIKLSAALAERSSRRVKQLDLLLSRVQEAKLVADSLQEMRRTVGAIRAMADSDDLHGIVELIHKYEDASRNLCGRAVPKQFLMLSDADSSEEGQEVFSASNDGGAEQCDDGSEAYGASLGASMERGVSKNICRGKWGGMRGHNAGGASAHSVGDGEAAESVIAEVRAIAREKILAKVNAATLSGDKTEAVRATRLLVLLGFREESCELYCKWVCNNTLTALHKMVEGELRKIDDPREVGMSHLVLVSTALDLVVATFEGEEEFFRDVFGNAGLLLLLTELHSRSTSQCVKVLEDFLTRRGEVLLIVSPNNGSGDASSSSSTSATAATLDPRQTDQILEEMSHLVTCCHLYWTFVQSKQQEYRKGLEKEEGTLKELHGSVDIEGADVCNKKNELSQLIESSNGSTSVDFMWFSRENPLMNKVQEMLASFVPLQKYYFVAAFNQALQLQHRALEENNKVAGMKAGVRSAAGGVGEAGGEKGKGNLTISSSTTSSSSNNAATTFMTGLAALYNSTTANSGAVVSNEIDSEDVIHATCGKGHLAPITLPDDVFFFLRTALHRAINTKSTQVISAVFIGCGDVVQSKMIPHIQRCVVLPSLARLQQLQQYGRQDQRRHEPQAGTTHATYCCFTVPTHILRWTAAAQCTEGYTRRLAEELRQLARSQFNGKDVLRFTEQAGDMDGIAEELASCVRGWLEKFAELCYTAHLAPQIEAFASLSYDITEEAFYHYELSDPWVQAFVAVANTALNHFDCYLDPLSFDYLLVALVRRLLNVLWQLLSQKRFSAYGALQMDREMRILRTFFLNRAHEEQLRESFVKIMSAVTLLLLDHPRDAEQLDGLHARQHPGPGTSNNGGLTAEEKRAVLSCRIEFKQEDILRLRL
ncbi:putative COG4 transport protein [Trypanosoma vivax]|nr:hypothetical protein TRVL_01608 [Trypanosoma vivax]KAH8616906.1 putative COG4 transport protein [Trypanosoma vivax]